MYILEFEDHHFSRCFDCSFKIVWGYPVLWCAFQLEPKNSDTKPHCRQWLPRLLGLEWWTFCWLLTFICFKLGTKKPVCYEKIWDETMSFAGMVCPGRAIEERNETSPKNLRNSSPMLLGRLCCWRVFFLKVGAFVFTPPEHGHETWILQSYTFSNMWTSLPCPFLGDWDVQIHTGSDLELFSPRWSNSYRLQTKVSTFEGVFPGQTNWGLHGNKRSGGYDELVCL